MRLFHRPLLIAVLKVTSHPKLSLLIASIVLVACVGAAIWKLEISTEQNKLFDPDVPFFRDYLAFSKNFPENEALYVLIEPVPGAPRPKQMPPPVPRWTAIADAIADRLRAMPDYVRAVDAKVPIDKLGSQGLLFDDPPRVRQAFEDIKQFSALAKLWAEQPTLLTRVMGSTPIERFLTALRAQPPSDEIAGFVKLLTDSWNATLSSAATQPVVPDLGALDAEDPSRLGYYYRPDESDRSKHVMLVAVYPKEDYTALTAVSENVEAIRAAARDVAKSFPEFKVGLTGRPALEADEMRTTDIDSHRAEIVALTAVFVGLVVVLRSFWMALAGEIALGVGIGWTFGWATITIGELNLLSIVFLLALIGIGMDYLVQVLTRYRLELSRRAHPATIWIGVFRHVAAPINTACLGAAGAFLVSTLTRFKGAAELGIIAGGGLLLCLISGYVVLPALLTIFPPKRPPRQDVLENRSGPGDIPVARGRPILPIVWIILLIAGVPFALRTQFDPALLKMQAPHLESVKLVSRLQTWSAVVLSKDLAVLRQARERVRQSSLVSHTESILMAYDNLEWLKTHEHELPAIAWSEPAHVGVADLGNIARKAAALAEHFAAHAGASASLRRFSESLNRAAELGEPARRLSDWQRRFVGKLRENLAQFHPSTLNLDSLPQELRSHYIGADGSFALYVYPTANLWDHRKLIQFSRDVEAKMHGLPGTWTLTGIAINIYHSTNSIEAAFYQSTAYALGLIFVLVLIDLRRVGRTLLAVSVLALGLPMLAAMMGLLDWLAVKGLLGWIGLSEVTWNFANFFGLPILIGAGHEYGVFLVHRYLEALRDPRRVWRRWDVSDRALALCAYVTCTSFGFFFLLAHHRGLRSLGLVMALGTACIYLAAVLVLRPMLLRKLERRRRSVLRIQAEQTRGPLDRQVVEQK